MDISHHHHRDARGVDVRSKLKHPIIDSDGHAVELRLAMPPKGGGGCQ